MYGAGASAIVVTGGRLTGNSATSSGGAINTSGPLTVTGTRIDHNHSGNSGGGLFVDIRNGFPARLERVEIDSNDASAGAVTRGGGIASLGHLDIVDSWIHDNFMSSSGQGAGLDLQPRNIGGAEPITISGTTISGNAAGTQGGDAIRFGGTSDPSSATIVRSTITGNGVDAVDALGGTGGVFAGPLWTIGLSSVTIAGNRATTAGGLADNLYVFPTAVVNAANTLIANPVAGLDCVAEGPLNALGGNAEYAATRTCGFENGADAALAVPTELGTLADNGGPTPTLALTAGSPARGQGAATCEATDQRGVARPAGGPCDPGAFQYPAPAPSDGGGDGGGGGTTTTPTTPTTPPVPVVPPAAPPVTAPGQVLLCEGAKITLVDLRRSRGRVVVTGAALTSLAGKRVTITADHGGAKRTATVARDGSFAATFPAPKSDQTSYAARYGDDRTSPLKLTRNLSVIAQRRTGTGVRIVARHSQGKRVKGQKATLRRTTGCGTQTVAGTARFDKHGRVTMTLAFPTPPDTVAVYRVTTRTNRTFTLPIVVR
jgi:predicted outer membrane repeat protein